MSQAEDEPQKDKPVAEHTPTKTRNKLVLVADDNLEILELTRLCLNSVGYETLGAENGKHALELFHQNRHEITLVVLDFVMPEMGGQEVVEQIRLVDSDVKILFVTGYIPEDVNASLKETIIRKPYKRTEFLKTIEQLLNS